MCLCRRWSECTHSQDIIEVAFDKSVEGGRSSPLLGSRLHDFGFRGCTCVEQVRDSHLRTRLPVAVLPDAPRRRASSAAWRTC